MATGNSPTPAAPLWHNRDYMLLWGGQVISTLGSRAASIIYPLLILAVPNSPGAAAVAAALRALPYLLFSLPVGALVDRWNRKNGMIICDLLRAMVVLTIRLALWFDLLTASRRVTGSQWPPWCSRTGPSTPHSPVASVANWSCRVRRPGSGTPAPVAEWPA